MRYVAFILLSIGVLAPLARGDAKADGRAIVEKAIKAAGGADNLAKFKSQQFSEKGKWFGMGEGLPYHGTFAVRWPDHFRMEIQGVFVIVVAGDKGWAKSDKGVTELKKDQVEREQRNLYCGYVASLLPLSDKSFTLTAQPETKVEDKAVLPVKVSKTDRPDVMLYFDKETGLLTKWEAMMQPNENEKAKGKEVKNETFLSKYKEFSGYKIPTHVLVKRDGKVYVESDMNEVKPVEKFDDKVFSKP